MNRRILLVAFMLLAVPAVAQDDGGFGFGGDSFGADSLGGDSGGDIFGSDPFSNNPIAPKVDPLIEIRNLLAQSAAPALDKKQEKPLKKTYDRERKPMAKAFEKRFGLSLDEAVAAQSRSRGRRGGGLSTSASREVQRITDSLRDILIANLTLEQQRILRTYQSEQLRTARLQQLNHNMAQAGIVPTPEQQPEIEALFARESRLRTLIIVESKGTPYQSKIAGLEAQTAERVAGLLNQPQALVAAMVRPPEVQPASRQSTTGFRSRRPGNRPAPVAQ